MEIIQTRIRALPMIAFPWIVASLFVGIESCENMTILCRYPIARPEVCNNTLCDCDFTAHFGSRHIICVGVLVEIPLGQLYETIHYAYFESNNITTIKNKTFAGLSAGSLGLRWNKIMTIETSAFQDMRYIKYIYLKGNLIKEIRPRTFNNMENLAVLLLSNNLITSLGEQAFINLPKLSTLYLDNNKLKTVGSTIFVNIPQLSVLKLSFNEIAVIEDCAFCRVSAEKIDLQSNKLTVITKGAFRDMSKGNTILLQGNKIEEIQSQAFQNIFNMSLINMSDSTVKTIRSYAFSNITADKLQIVIADGLLQRIEQNAFYNITGDILVLGVSTDLSFKENFLNSRFNQIHFTQNGNPINCNCTMMWLALWLQEGRNRESIHDGALCNDPKNKPVSNLTLDDFSHCKEMSDRYECHETNAVILNCSLSFVSGNFIEWIHLRNGIYIRTLKTLTNILSIPFCSLDDIGEYTCVRSTLHSAVPYINTTTSLHVKGKPVITNHQTFENGADLVLSVTIFTTDAADIQWFFGSIKLTNDANYMINTSVVPQKITQYNTAVVVDNFMTNLTIRNSLSTKAYSCRIFNEVGTVEQVLLSRPIVIVLQPNTLCDTSSRLEINCTLNYDRATPKYFQHTVGGKLIRTLTGSRVNNTYTLVIPFCNSQDLGDYTCYWETVSGLEVFSKQTTLTVNGPPIILYHTETAVDKLIVLSVMFLSYPYPMEPQWFYNDVAIVPSSDIQQTTSISTVEMQLHRVTAYVNGFISNLTIKEGSEGFSDYKCVVKNAYGASVKTITRYKGLSSPGNISVELLAVVLGSIAVGATVIIILIVVFVQRKQKNKQANSRTYTESTNRCSHGTDTYDVTTEQDYIEITE